MTAEQPRHVPGAIDVTPVARTAFLEMLVQREAKGIEVYGVTLQSHNGRDAVRDAMEEAVDLWQYLVQIGLERESMLALIADLRTEIARLRAEAAP